MSIEIPRKINIGSGKNFRDDYINIDINAYWNPDICFDLNQPFPEKDGQIFETHRFGEVQIYQNSFSRIVAWDVLEHITNLTTLMECALNLLEVGGLFEILVPYDLSYGAWQDPTHVRAFNENSWNYYTEWFWYLGWEKARFNIETLHFKLNPFGDKLLADGKSTEEIIRSPRAVDTMHVILKKMMLSDLDKQTLQKHKIPSHDRE